MTSVPAKLRRSKPLIVASLVVFAVIFAIGINRLIHPTSLTVVGLVFSIIIALGGLAGVLLNLALLLARDTSASKQ